DAALAIGPVGAIVAVGTALRRGTAAAAVDVALAPVFGLVIAARGLAGAIAHSALAVSVFAASQRIVTRTTRAAAIDIGLVAVLHDVGAGRRLTDRVHAAPAATVTVTVADATRRAAAAAGRSTTIDVGLAAVAPAIRAGRASTSERASRAHAAFAV